MLSDPGAGQVSHPAGIPGLTGRHEAAVFYMASDAVVWGRHFPPGQVQLRLSLLCPGAPDLWKTGSLVGPDPLKLPLAQGRCWRKSLYLIPLLSQSKVYFHQTRLPAEFVSNVPALSLNHQLQRTPHKTEGHSFIHSSFIHHILIEHKELAMTEQRTLSLSQIRRFLIDKQLSSFPQKTISFGKPGSQVHSTRVGME